jgi:hypothetical protein
MNNEEGLRIKALHLSSLAKFWRMKKMMINLPPACYNRMGREKSKVQTRTDPYGLILLMHRGGAPC